MSEILPQDPRIVDLIEEIMNKGAEPSGDSIVWNVPFIADILCQALNQHTPPHAMRSAEEQLQEQNKKLLAALEKWWAICEDKKHSLKFEDGELLADAYKATFNALHPDEEEIT